MESVFYCTEKLKACRKIQVHAHLHLCIFILCSHDFGQKCKSYINAKVSIPHIGLRCIVCVHIHSAHLLLAHLSFALSAQSERGLANRGWSTRTATDSDWCGHRWTNCPLSSHTQVMEGLLRWLTCHETRPADETERVKAADPARCLIS